MRIDEIHIASGLGSSINPAFRAGTQALELKIDSMPADAQHWIWNAWPQALEEIAARASMRKPRRVVLIGHSNGVIFTNQIADGLRKLGIQVDLLVALDPTLAAFPKLGTNVKRTMEFHATAGIVAMFRWVASGGKLRYTRDFAGKTEPAIIVPGGHVGLSVNPAVHKRVLQAVQETLK